MLEGNGEIKKKEWKEFTRFSLVIKILTDILYFPIAVGLCGFFFCIKDLSIGKFRVFIFS